MAKSKKPFIKPEHWLSDDRQIGLMGVDLVMSRVRKSHIVMKELREIYKPLLSQLSYSNHAPFQWVGLVFRYGLVNNLVPEYKRVNKKYGDLPIAVELDAHALMYADQNDLEMLRKIFEIATLEALIHVGEKYDLPTEVLKKRRAALGDMPVMPD